MSTKEIIYSMIDEFSEEQLVQVCALLASVKKCLTRKRRTMNFAASCLTTIVKTATRTSTTA